MIQKEFDDYVLKLRLRKQNSAKLEKKFLQL